MVEFWFSKGEMSKAFDLVQEMSSRGISLTSHIDKQMLQNIHEVWFLCIQDYTFVAPAELSSCIFVQAAGVKLRLQVAAEDEIVENIDSSNSDLTD